MSEVTEPRLNLDEQIARIERAQAETRKFVAEYYKLTAEASKLDRDRSLSVLLAIAGLLGGIVTVASLVLRLFGHGG